VLSGILLSAISSLDELLAFLHPPPIHVAQGNDLNVRSFEKRLQIGMQGLPAQSNHAHRNPVAGLFSVAATDGRRRNDSRDCNRGADGGGSLEEIAPRKRLDGISTFHLTLLSSWVGIRSRWGEC